MLEQHKQANSSSILLRNGKVEDYPLLREAFLFSYAHRNSWYGSSTPVKLLRIKFDAILDSPNWQQLIACPGEDSQDEIMGALIWRPALNEESAKRVNSYIRNFPQVAWLTVKPTYQRKGVAKALLKATNLNPPCIIECAFVMPDIHKKAIELGYQLRFKPYLPDIELLSQAKGLDNG